MKRLATILCAISVFCSGFAFSATPTAVDERLQQLVTRFPAADLNHDGKLSTDEFRQFRGEMQSGGTTSSTPSTIVPAETPAPAGKVTIKLTSANPVPINPKIYGINCAEMFIFDLVQKPEYLAALGELQFNTFLFPGGSSYHHPTGTGGFNIKEEEIAQSKHGSDHRINKVGSPDFFLQYLGFMKPMGGHAVFIPNIPNGTVEELDWYMKKMTDTQVPVETVVLGMEVQLGAFRFESSADYIAKIKPIIELLKAKYPKVRIVGWSTPVGRKSGVPESFRQWNRDVAQVPGIDDFAQYGWTEFASAAMRKRGSGEVKTPEQRLGDYDAFVQSFPEKEIKAYANDWGADKKMFMLQWGTHADRNTALEGLHSVNFLFFMTEYNATHDNYFEVATWSVPLMSDLTSGKRKGSGGGVTYQQDIALWSPYLYAKPLRQFYSGDKSLLTAAVVGVGVGVGCGVWGVEKQGAMEVVKALASAGPDGKKYLCILNRGLAIALNAITVDGKPLASDASVHIESVSGDTLTTTGGSLKTFVGDKSAASLSIEPFSVTTLTLP
ncbi:EF-hand domain-containing protein [Prosthecobacter sp.]|uniref:EF-hand domain-containing protein n=1 Tax=Prosthecobacter sp. TaxID=1965333 RepID=UPI002ABBA042|nr:EF-hand domain-containing protein [Prosthecobacter sp.]MDZ4403270.1 EF-hand domain-containing protein [Prosthecobacter sp.]